MGAQSQSDTLPNCRGPLTHRSPRNGVTWLVQCATYTAVPSSSARTSGLLVLPGHGTCLTSCGGMAQGTQAKQPAQLSSQPLCLHKAVC